MLPETQRVSPLRDQGGKSKHELLGESFSRSRPWDPAQPSAVPRPTASCRELHLPTSGCWGPVCVGVLLQAKTELSSRKGLVGQELASPYGSISKGASSRPDPLYS